MAKYILSYDKNTKDDPFEKIIEILYNTKIDMQSIERPVESTLIFDYPPRISVISLNDIIGADLKQICFYVLAEVLGKPTNFIDMSLTQSNSEKITEIINRLKQK